MQQIWIIGASSGIGLSVAQAYANKGHNVLVSARNEQKLKELCEGNDHLHPVPLDATDSASIQSAQQAVKNITGHLDKVIINAGTAEYVDLLPVDVDLVRRVFEINFFGAINMVNASLPFLYDAVSEGQKPQLVIVSSSVSYQALTRAHAYGASKAAIRYFTECLKADVQHQGVDVRVVSPGFVKTPLTDKNDFEMPFLITSEEAAKRIIKGLNGSRFDIHFPKRFTLLLKLFSFLPHRVKFWLLGKMSRFEPQGENS